MDKIKIEFEGREYEVDICPFCGGEPEIVKFVRCSGEPWDENGWYEADRLEWKYLVRCTGGGCPIMPETVMCETPEMAVALWNRRHVKQDGKEYQ